MITLDKGHNVPVYSKVCTFCLHWHVEAGRTCDAFHDGIPMPIWMAKNDHTQPYPGDHGIQFEPLPKEPEPAT